MADIDIANPGASAPALKLALVDAISPLDFSDGLQINVTNPTVGDDPNLRRALDVHATYDTINSNIGFTNQEASHVSLDFNHGLNVYGGGTNAKFTPITMLVHGQFVGAGEKFGFAVTALHYSMGDSFLMSGQCHFSGGPIAGDEGQAFSPSMNLTQAPQLCLNTITQPPVTSGYSTTTTSAVTASKDPQNIPVASTVGAVVGDWVVLNQQLPSGTPNIAPMQIISISAGVSINGICPINMPSGALIKPTLCLVLVNTIGFGQDRCLVNVSQDSYSTGTVDSIAGGGFIGVGTDWTVDMVGGDALNIGAIYLDADTYTNAPYDGTNFPDQNTALHSYYQINGISSPTGLGVVSFSVAGDAAYHGNGVDTTKTYKIQPCARVLYVNPPGSPYSVICEYTTATWENGDIVELAICPYPDVAGWTYKMAQFTPGGVRRHGINLSNTGARMFDSAFTCNGAQGTTGQEGSDDYAWKSGFYVDKCQIGMNFSTSNGLAMQLPGLDNATNASGTIQWHDGDGRKLQPDNARDGFKFKMAESNGGAKGTLAAIASAYLPSGNQPTLIWGGVMGTIPVLFATLPTAASAEGMEVSITDGSTAAWGATCAGGGASHVKVRSNGTNWTVVGA